MSSSTNSLIQRGSVSVFFGPMFSGKSTSLLKKIVKHETRGSKVLVVNYAHDTRYSEDASLVTHAKDSHKAYKCYDLVELDTIFMDYDVIAIDEGQFFHNCSAKCDEYANAGKKVYVAALDATFQRKSFNDITSILPIAEKVVKLRARCNLCSAHASYSSRKILSKQIELIGGDDIYEPLCRTCFLQKEEEMQITAAAESQADNLSSEDSIDCIDSTPSPVKQKLDLQGIDNSESDSTQCSGDSLKKTPEFIEC